MVQKWLRGLLLIAGLCQFSGFSQPVKISFEMIQNDNAGQIGYVGFRPVASPSNILDLGVPGWDSNATFEFLTNCPVVVISWQAAPETICDLEWTEDLITWHSFSILWHGSGGYIDRVEARRRCYRVKYSNPSP